MKKYYVPNPVPTPPGCLTAVEAAKFLDIDAGLLAAWRKRDSRFSPPFHKVGSQIYYRQRTLQVWKMNHSTEGTVTA